jgi:phage tail tube protein FII
MSVSKDTFFLFVLFMIYIGGDIYTAKVAHQKLETVCKEASDYSIGGMLRNARLEARIDSLKIETEALAKTVIYLDSCQQQKVQKQDKAEKRGRFVGGLLRGLFPGI